MLPVSGPLTQATGFSESPKFDVKLTPMPPAPPSPESWGGSSHVVLGEHLTPTKTPGGTECEAQGQETPPICASLLLLLMLLT